MPLSPPKPYTLQEDFNRPLYLIYGLPFDAVSMDQALDTVAAAMTERKRCFLSTPNLNFLVTSRSNETMFESVQESDLSVADGMPIVWMAKALGVPVVERVGGSNLFERMMQGSAKARVFFFGGLPQVAEQACEALPCKSDVLLCGGFLDPGFGSLESQSSSEILDQIEASKSDFLLIALGALKGQSWIMRNADKLSAPVIVHLGAVINFVAGHVNRAPESYQKAGLEWLWRIKEEPTLWKRYWNDGWQFLNIALRKILPYSRWLKKNQSLAQQPLQWQRQPQQGATLYRLSGSASASGLDAFIDAVIEDIAAAHNLTLDLSSLQYADSRFFAVLMLIRKHCQRRELGLRLVVKSVLVRRLLRWNGVADQFIYNDA